MFLRTSDMRSGSESGSEGEGSTGPRFMRIDITVSCVVGHFHRGKFQDADGVSPLPILIPLAGPSLHRSHPFAFLLLYVDVLVLPPSSSTLVGISIVLVSSAVLALARCCSLCRHSFCPSLLRSDSRCFCSICSRSLAVSPLAPLALSCSLLASRARFARLQTDVVCAYSLIGARQLLLAIEIYNSQNPHSPIQPLIRMLPYQLFPTLTEIPSPRREFKRRMYSGDMGLVQVGDDRATEKLAQVGITG